MIRVFYVACLNLPCWSELYERVANSMYSLMEVPASYFFFSGYTGELHVTSLIKREKRVQERGENSPT
jgi:hypothetical protein